MIVTQRQLEHLLKLHGRIVLPYRARLSPAAQDWVRHSKTTIGYDGIETIDLNAKPAATPASESEKGRFLWWSDGPDGVAKAAIGMSAREVRLESMQILEDASRAISAVRALSRAIHAGQAVGGVLLVKNAGPAVIWANKAPNLRAVVATTMAAVEESITTMAANVMVVERDKWPLSPLKNLLVRFGRLERKIDPVVEQELKALSTCCGGCAHK